MSSVEPRWILREGGERAHSNPLLVAYFNVHPDLAPELLRLSRSRLETQTVHVWGLDLWQPR